MNWNDYEAVWKRQPTPAGAAASVNDLKRTFDDRHRKLAATLRVRDFAEASAGVLVAVVFAVAARHQKTTVWPIWTAVALVFGVTGFFLRERLRARRKKLGPEASLREKVDADLAELRHQRRLLANVWWWYLAPLAGAVLLFCAAIYLNRPVFDRALMRPVLAIYGVVVAGSFWFAWFINRRAVRKQIDPRLEELEKLRHELDAL